MTKLPILLGIHYSPWTERARWALDHHKIPYHYREYTPLVGELALRFHARNQTRSAPPSVPILIRQNGDNIMGSEALFRHADIHGQGPSLLLQNPEVSSWFATLEPTLHAVRKRVTHNFLNDPEALLEAARTITPKKYAHFARPLAAFGAKFIAWKYNFSPNDGDDTSTLRPTLLTLRTHLQNTSSLYLFRDTFSAIDILAATLIQGLEPPKTFIPLPPATARAWTHAPLRDEFSDLIAWRDTLYKTHRTS